MRFRWLWNARDLTWTRRVDPGPIGRRTLWERGASVPSVQAPTDLLPSGEQSRFSALRHRDGYAASWIRRFPLDASPRLLSQQRHEP